ncbi:MAG: helix-turn-helix transcriptional regulator [Quisquiliibacterium sp.]
MPKPERSADTPADSAPEDFSRRDWLDTREVADLLRLRPRTVYHLVSRGEIPHSRARGKLLFERAQIEHWLGSRTAGALESAQREPPPVIAGSHDPLLDWAVRESRCALALATVGSTEGIDRFIARSACAALIHIPNERDQGFNDEALRIRAASLPVVALHWARREQGLLLAPGNPLRIKRLADLARGKRRFAMRQPGAGSQLLLARLARQEGISLTALRPAGPLFSSETDVAQAVANGFADGGFAIRAAAAQYGLEFLPLAWESVELALWRRTAFEAPMQTLLALTRSRRFARQAELLGGYDISGCGMVRFNA